VLTPSGAKLSTLENEAAPIEAFDELEDEEQFDDTNDEENDSETFL
jgi:hypothetical protein